MDKAFDIATDLRQFPQIAQLLGFYTAAFCGMELSLWLLYGHILDMAEDEAMVLLGSLQSFSLKHDAVSRIFDRRRDSFKDAAEIEAALREARAVNTARNRFMHSLYLTDAEYTEVRLLPFATDSSRMSKKPNPERLVAVTEDSIRDEIRRIDSVHRRLVKITARSSVTTHR